MKTDLTMFYADKVSTLMGKIADKHNDKFDDNKCFHEISPENAKILKQWKESFDSDNSIKLIALHNELAKKIC